MNAANTCGCTLERFNSRRMIMRFNLEYHAVSIAHIHQSRVFFTRLHQHSSAFARKCLQPPDGILITAMLTPHAAECTEFIEVGCSTQFLLDQLKFFFCQSELLRCVSCNFHAICFLAGAYDNAADKLQKYNQ